MGASIQIKTALAAKGLKIGDIAERLDINARTLSNKLYRDTMSYSDVQQIAAAMGCSVVIRDDETGKTY